MKTQKWIACEYEKGKIKVLVTKAIKSVEVEVCGGESHRVIVK